MRHRYFVHIDPSTTTANTAVVVAHVETMGDEHHIVVDLIHVWHPGDFPGGHMDYHAVVGTVVTLHEAFAPISITVDAYGGHVLHHWLMERLGSRAGFTAINVLTANHHEKPARYDRLRTLAIEGHLHLPPHELAHREFSFVQQQGATVGAPDRGPCRTDDTVDSIAWICRHALDQTTSRAHGLGHLGTRGSSYSWQDNPYGQAFKNAKPTTTNPHHNPARGRR